MCYFIHKVTTHNPTHKLNQQLTQLQSVAATCLEKIITSIKYLAEEGLALRGHESDTGHLIGLLNLRALDISDLSEWLMRHE